MRTNLKESLYERGKVKYKNGWLWETTQVELKQQLRDSGLLLHTEIKIKKKDFKKFQKCQLL